VLVGLELACHAGRLQHGRNGDVDGARVGEDAGDVDGRVSRGEDELLFYPSIIKIN